MRHGFFLLLIGLGLIAVAWIYGGFWLTLHWPALSFLTVSSGYFWFGPAVFGKGHDGRQPLARSLILLPYLLFTWLVWRMQVLLSSEACFHTIAPGVHLGRRASRSELPPDTRCVVDLTAEFREPLSVRQVGEYLCVPTLDGTACDPAALVAAIDRILERRGVFIHCAQGHGRSGMLAAALLIARGDAADAEAAEALVRRARPGVRLNLQQRVGLQSVAPQLARLRSARV